jgi:hypothetical protein
MASFHRNRRGFQWEALRGRVIMTGPQLLAVVSRVCAGRYEPGRVRARRTGKEKGLWTDPEPVPPWECRKGSR